MIFHIFNPEHDIALASNLANFTAPHAGRQLRRDLGYLPALWSDEGHRVIVDDVETARKGLQKLLSKFPQVKTIGRQQQTEDFFCTIKHAAKTDSKPNVRPWGWNTALKAWLIRYGIEQQVLPSDSELSTIRELSHRSFAASILPLLRDNGTVGETYQCCTMEEIEGLLSKYCRLVLKAPWSSSGRGLRFLDVHHSPASTQAGWIRNVVAAQGGVMVEPYYNKVKDFGMEFYTDGMGHTDYLGLSLFHTKNGAYTGNLLATEKWKEKRMTDYVSEELLTLVRTRICELTAQRFAGKYCGPFGVDMMIIASDDGNGFLLHPCVEINLRRTMGHVAISLEKLLNPSDDNDLVSVMRIEYKENNYKLTVKKL